MKMNKLVKGLLVGFIALQMVGCEEAKEVENIEVQDTKPVVEEIEETHYIRECQFCGQGLYSSIEEVNIALHDLSDKIDHSTGAKRDEYIESFLLIQNFLGCSECMRVQDVCNNNTLTHDEFANEIAHVDTCTAPHKYSMKGDVCGEAPTAMTAEEFDNAKCENCGHDVSNVIDNAGGYWCEACDYVK